MRTRARTACSPNLSAGFSGVHPCSRERSAPGAGPQRLRHTKPSTKITEESLFPVLMGLMQAAGGASVENFQKIETGSADLARVRAAARREGIPLTPKKFQRPAPPVELNAAPIYERLISLRKMKPLDPKLEEMALHLSSRYPYGPDDVAAARKLLAERQDMLTLAHQAMERPFCMFQKDWSQGSAIMFPEFAAVREATRLLSIESHLLALDGHLEAAIANQSRGFRAAAHIGSEGTLIGYLAGIACESITLNGLQDILYLAGPNAEIAQSVQTAITDNRPTYSFRRAMEGEVMLQVGTMNQIRQLGPRSIFMLSGGTSEAEANKAAAVWEARPIGRRYWKLVTDAGEANLLQKMRQAFAISQRPYREQRKLWGSWLASVEDRTHGIIGIFGAVLLPVFPEAQVKEMHARAQEEVTMSGAMVLAFKARHDRWPERLEETMPTAPIDPFTHRPLRYRREASGFIIYSLGSSGIDDGGQFPAPRGTAKEWKSIFRYPSLSPHAPPTPLPIPPLAPLPR